VNNHNEALNFFFLHGTQKIPFPLTYENISYSDVRTNMFFYILKYIFKPSVHMRQNIKLHFENGLNHRLPVRVYTYVVLFGSVVESYRHTLCSPLSMYWLASFASFF
jgi:hypothetical protein